MDDQTPQHPPTPVGPYKLSDEQLLAAWAAGAPEAIERLFERYYRDVYRFFANRVGGDCDDLTQATFLACLECLSRFRSEASFRSLLFTIARNKLCGYLRARGRARRQVELSPLAPRPPSPAAELLRQREWQQLRGAIAELPADTRAMFEGLYWQAKGVKDIAASLGVPVSTVKTRMRRARMRLAYEVRPSR